MFVVNAQSGKVDVLDVVDPSTPMLLFTITVNGVANSIASEHSPLPGVALLVVANEGSGTTTISRIDRERLVGSGFFRTSSRSTE